MKSKSIDIAFTPVDNNRLANLCGTLDENLKQIETALDVRVSRRGENFSVGGRPQQSRLAVQALQMFYTQARHALSVDEIQLGLIELNSECESEGAVDMVPVLLTRKHDLAWAYSSAECIFAADSGA